MDDSIMQIRVDPISKRALEIYCATEGKSKKDIISNGINMAIPAQYLTTAREQLDKEERAKDGAGTNQ